MYTLITYNILSMPELVWKFSTFKLRWFPLFAVFTPLNVWTDEGQPCEKSASCSILPAFRKCTHTITQTRFRSTLEAPSEMPTIPWKIWNIWWQLFAILSVAKEKSHYPSHYMSILSHSLSHSIPFNPPFLVSG